MAAGRYGQGGRVVEVDTSGPVDAGRVAAIVAGAAVPRAGEAGDPPGASRGGRR